MESQYDEVLISQKLLLYIEYTIEEVIEIKEQEDFSGLKFKGKKLLESSLEFYNNIYNSSRNEKEKIDSLQKYLEFMRKYLSVIKQKAELKDLEEPTSELVKMIKNSLLALKVALIKRLNESKKEDKETFIISLISNQQNKTLTDYIDYSNKKASLLEKVDKAGKTSLKFILLYGSKGNGKELLIRTVAKEAKCYFLNLNCLDYFSNIENFPVVLLKVALNFKPLIVFIPDIEDFNKQREKLMYFITKIQENKANHILVVGSSTQPEKIHPEVSKYFASNDYIGPFLKESKPFYVKSLLNGYKYNITNEQFKEMGSLLLKHSNEEIKQLIKSVLLKANTNDCIEYEEIIQKLPYHPGSISTEMLIKFKKLKI